MEGGANDNMSKTMISELIQMIDEYHETGALGYSTYKEIMAKVREIQVER